MGGPENVARARDVYRRANVTFKQADEKEERLMLLEAWKEFEVCGDLSNFNQLALKSGIDSHPESPQVGHSQPANTAQRLNSVYVVASRN